jgi:tetraacyldisaccharide 4'-kinase
MRLKNWIACKHYPPQGQLAIALWPLLPLSWLYGLGIQLRLLAYRFKWLKSYQPQVPVISIGNLTTGGTGKTPIVIELARGLIRAGKTVVILSRGYGATQPVDYSRAVNPNHGDEAYMVQEQVPEAVVIVGRDRVSTLQRAIRDYRPDYVLLDDGFQYLRLSRAMNILLIDGERLLGNGRLLPAGPLREPLAEIQRADIIFLTQTVTQDAMKTVEQWVNQYGHPPQNQKLPAQILPVEFKMVGLRPMADFKVFSRRPLPFQQFLDRPVIAFSGIANPEAFEQGLQTQGFRLLETLRFADHHAYTSLDVEHIMALFHRYQAENPILVTTDKDLPKVRLWLTEAAQQETYTLQRLPSLDGRWFYDEFITQIPGFVQAGKHAHCSGYPR